ncbi:fimbria/pilus outer membrane usher protein [Providencia stuartii]|uniref:fimbria/pilus outer membrane usher protein n=1 Tax=Providencia stuartii TaxID=588 RepID=UPI0025AABF64|nr:fimbria/pilus outer membrane usher protein [Providencia stuartii]MDN0018154.1 fimbria/pilus outer membrane usher protein [Providencia stuartii]
MRRIIFSLFCLVGTNNGMAVIDSRGYAIVPNMMEYSQNIINLDINTLPTDVESKETSVNVYPTKGALVKTQFNTLKGYQAMLTLTGPKTIPMGAVASLQQSEQDSSSLISGIVGENGRVYTVFYQHELSGAMIIIKYLPFS